MNRQLINSSNGEFTISDHFVISNRTRLSELLNYFGEDKLKKSPYLNTETYFLPQIEIGGLYFRFGFYFDGNTLKKVSFEIEVEPIKREPWSNNRDFETAWIAQQMNDTSHFKWDMEIAGRHYHLAYDWGNIGVYYDFKNGTFESVLYYNL